MKTIICALSFSFLMVMSLGASAQKLQSGPTVTVSGSRIIISGKITGCGNTTVDVDVTATARANGYCKTKSGSTTGAGSCSDASAAGGEYLQPKNGVVNFSITIDASTLPALSSCVNSLSCPGTQSRSVVYSVVGTPVIYVNQVRVN